MFSKDLQLALVASIAISSLRGSRVQRVRHHRRRPAESMADSIAAGERHIRAIARSGFASIVISFTSHRRAHRPLLQLSGVECLRTRDGDTPGIARHDLAPVVQVAQCCKEEYRVAEDIHDYHNSRENGVGHPSVSVTPYAVVRLQPILVAVLLQIVLLAVECLEHGAGYGGMQQVQEEDCEDQNSGHSGADALDLILGHPARGAVDDLIELAVCHYAGQRDHDEGNGSLEHDAIPVALRETLGEAAQLHDGEWVDVEHEQRTVDAFEEVGKAPCHLLP